MEMDDAAKVMVAISLFGSVAYSISAIARATVANRKEGRQLEKESATPVSEARLARIEQAVDAIALEVERISEGQRFTTKLLSESGQRLPKPTGRQLASNKPT
jgi:hypothetical protein